jgi:hypothetical protein
MKKIHYELESDIAHIRMDDGKANAMDFDFFEEMGRALDRLEGGGAESVIIEKGKLEWEEALGISKMLPKGTKNKHREKPKR